MAKNNLGESFLVQQFQEFYRELLTLKQMILNETWVYKGDSLENNPEFSDAAGWISHLLTILINEQAKAAYRYGGKYTAQLYEEAKYVIAALADETFLSIEWTGKSTWSYNLLETRHFKTSVSGERFFQNLDELLDKRDGGSVELARIYLYSLSLGFRGKYGWSDDEDKIGDYRKELFEFIFHHKPNLSNREEFLFPDSYSYTLEDDEERKLPGVRKWVFSLGALFFVLLGISHLLWLDVSLELDQITHEINGILSIEDER